MALVGMNEHLNRYQQIHIGIISGFRYSSFRSNVTLKAGWTFANRFRLATTKAMDAEDLRDPTQ